MTPPNRPSLPKIYFTEDTEKAIIEYSSLEPGLEREYLFRKRIYPAMDKLVENIINRFKFPYVPETFDTIKNQVLSHIVLNLHKYKPGKGKAFSYFSIVAKNYLILHNNNFYKEEKRMVYLTEEDPCEPVRDELIIPDTTSTVAPPDVRDFFILSLRYWEEKIPVLFPRERDMAIAYGVLRLMERVDKIENFNKKALYIMLREMTDYKTSHITRVVHIMRHTMAAQYQEFLKTGHMTDPDTLEIYTNE